MRESMAAVAWSSGRGPSQTQQLPVTEVLCDGIAGLPCGRGRLRRRYARRSLGSGCRAGRGLAGGQDQQACGEV